MLSSILFQLAEMNKALERIATALEIKNGSKNYIPLQQAYGVPSGLYRRVQGMKTDEEVTE